MRSLVARAALVAVLGGLASLALAGTIDPNLQDVMNIASDKEPISVLVFPRDTGNIKALNQELNRTRATRQVRHESVVRSLQTTALQTQQSMLAHVDSLTGRGGVSSYTAYWVDNSVHMVATKDAIKEIAERDDVEMVYYDYELELIRPIQHAGGEPEVADVMTPTTGLVAVRAPEVWAMGFDGTGVLTSSLDTGVDGNHPALASRWRGLDPRYTGHPQWAWFDPQTNTTFPQSFGAHGTHTMGTILGGAPGQQVGVAPGAQWIHAAVIDRVSIPTTVAQAKLAFQWLLDPDGNPATVWDVPTSCSNSWGVTTSHGYPPCDQNFWSYMDNCEAAGIVVVFAAGNEGPSAQTIRRPADRATTERNAFSVAAVDGNTAGWPIGSFSSRGPTTCASGGQAIKPEVSAPGVGVYSSVPGGGYEGGWDGTSMATPHVNGVVVLIRQACPDLSVDEVKQILIDTAHDLGTPGNDNNYGYGMVDAVAAVNMALGMCSGAPRAFDMSLQTPVDAPLTIALHASDYDHLPNPPGQLSYILTSLPLAGNTLTDLGNGHVIEAGELPYTLVNNGSQVLYTPATGYYGTDPFQFKANDGGVPPDGGDSNFATVTVLVSYPPPTVTTSTLPQGVKNFAYGPVQLEATLGQPPLTWTVVPAVPSGMTFNSAGVLGGTPTANGTFALSFRVTDGLGRLASRQLSLVVSLGPQPPQAQSQAVSTPVNTAVPITLVALDDGLPGGPLTYSIVTLPAHGTLIDPNVGTINTAPYVIANGGHLVNYAPSWWYLGSDSFTFKANDGGTAPAGGDSQPATVTLTVPVPPAQNVVSFPLDTDPGWTTEGQWAFGPPAGGGTHYRDPSSAHTGANVYGYNLNGDYASNMAQYNLTTTAIDCTYVLFGQLKFWRWLGVEDGDFDHATVQVSNDGANWTTLWANPSATISDTAWSQMTFDISAVADRQPTVYVRWTMGPTDGSVTYPGWNIDDVEIWGVQFTAPPACRGDCNCDGQVGFADIDYFVSAIPDNEAGWKAYYAARHGGNQPPCSFASCDITGDGHVDFADIDPFVALIPSVCP